MKHSFKMLHIYSISCENALSRQKGILKTVWTYLYFGALQRVIVVFPVIPHYSIRSAYTGLILAIQVGLVAMFVPPGTFISQSTVIAKLVIITILGSEWRTAVISHGVSSGTCKKYRLNYLLFVADNNHYTGGRVISLGIRRFLYRDYRLWPKLFYLFFCIHWTHKPINSCPTPVMTLRPSITSLWTNFRVPRFQPLPPRLPPWHNFKSGSNWKQSKPPFLLQFESSTLQRKQSDCRILRIARNATRLLLLL